MTDAKSTEELVDDLVEAGFLKKVGPSTELEQIPSQIIEGLSGGSIPYEKLVALLAPPPEPVKGPTKLPLPAVITDKERKALEQFFKVYGKVVPTERRALTTSEVGFLIDEREVLDDMLKMLDKRKDGIRTAIFNHFDVQAEAEGRAFPAEVLDDDGKVIHEATERNKDGFYVLDDEVIVPDREIKFRREVSSGSVNLSEVKLRALADDDSFPLLSHQDYLDMTEPVRTVRPDRVMDKLKKRPELAAAIRRCITTGSRTAAFWPRRVK